MFQYISAYTKALLFLPGTILHELSHAVFGFIFGEVHGFSLLPKIDGSKIVLGSVQASAKFKILLLPVALAPLVWWVLLYYLFLLDYIPFAKELPDISIHTFFLVYVCWQLLLAGRPSTTDLGVALTSIFSISGIFLLTITAILLYLFI